MITFSIILSPFILILISLYLYRIYMFNNLTYKQLYDKNKSYRKLIHSMNYNQRNSILGKNIIKAFNKTNDRLKYLESLVGKSTKGGGNYVENL